MSRIRPYLGLHGFLKHGRRRRKRGGVKESKGAISGRVSIEHRPDIVGHRMRPEDYEANMMTGRNRKGAVLVVTDRTTLNTRIRKLHGRHSKVIKKALIKEMGNVPYPVHNISFDNEKELSCHQKVSRDLEIETNFTRPYTSQDMLRLKTGSESFGVSSRKEPTSPRSLRTRFDG